MHMRGKEIFTMKEIAPVAQMRDIQHPQLKKILSNFIRRGWIIRLHRGLYASVGSLFPDLSYTHPFAIAVHLVKPAAISHWSALNYHGLTEQIPNIVTAITTKKVVTPSMRLKNSQSQQTKHSWEIAGIQYEYITVKPENFNRGIENIWINERYLVPITDKERTLLDVFIYSKMFGGIGEALNILQHSLSEIDVKKLVQYATEYGKKSTIKRLGWGLEYFGISSKYLKPLLNEPASYYSLLDQAGEAKGPCDKHWMIQNNLKGMP
jgi:predicted transcriptional regulator of viral defense system